MTVLTSDDEIMANASALPAPAMAPAPPPDFGTLAAESFHAATGAAERFEPSNQLADWLVHSAPGVAHDVVQPGFFPRLKANVEAGANRAAILDNTTADDNAMARQYEPIVEAINRTRGPFEQVQNPYGAPGLDAGVASWMRPLSDLSANMWGMKTRADHENDIWSALGDLAKRNPSAVANLPKNKAELLADMQDEQRQALTISNLLDRNGDQTSRAAGQFVGQAAGGFVDPPNQLLSALGAPAAKTLLGTFLTEGTLNAGLDLAGMGQRAERYSRLGEPMTREQEAEEVAGAFLVGGAVPTGFKALGRVLGLSDHAIVGAFDKTVKDPGPLARTARIGLQDEAWRADTSPFENTDMGRRMHALNLLSVGAQMDAGYPVHVPIDTAEAARMSRETSLRADLADVESKLANAQPPEADAADRFNRLQAVEAQLAGNKVQGRERAALLSRHDELLGGDTREDLAKAAAVAQQQEALGRQRDTTLAQLDDIARERDASRLEQAQAWAQHVGQDVPSLPLDERAPVHVSAAGGRPPESGVLDPMGLKGFTDPVGDRTSLDGQTNALARELAPKAFEPKPEPEPKAEGAKPEAEAEPKPEFGPAQQDIEALRAIDDKTRMPDPFGEGETSVKSVRQEIERQSRAVERLRGCIGDEA